MSKYLLDAVGPVPQSEPLPGQVPNSAGGHAWAVDDWKRLQRFLILGSEGGTYYASERKITRENLGAVERCIKADGPRTVRTVLDISVAGRAHKQDPGIMALALAAKTGDELTRSLAFTAVPAVCRTGTALLHFAAFCNELGGWGRGTKRAVGRWFTSRSIDDLAYQLVKYQQRDGWAQRDLLRLSHPKPTSAAQAGLFKWVTKRDEVLADGDVMLPEIVVAFEAAKTAASAREVAALIRKTNLPREAVPTQWLTSPEVWEALLERAPLHMMLRNLPTMTRVGLLGPGTAALAKVVTELTDPVKLTKSRVHPMAVLTALLTYSSGKSTRGDSTWTPVSRVVDALDAAFYASFGNVEPTGKRMMLALDVSGSMGDGPKRGGSYGCYGGSVGGVPNLSPMTCAVAMAMITAAVEKDYVVRAFDTDFYELDISPRRRLDDNVNALKRNGGGTECALPMLEAARLKQDWDTFVVYTDSETWAGRVHPTVALTDYRRNRVPDARLAVVATVSNGFTIADPNDAGMLDVVGFDTSTPHVLSEFTKGA